MEKSICKNIIFKFILNIFNIIVPIFIGSYVLRVLGPKNMGNINFSQTIFGYFNIFATFGVYNYGLREISKVRDNKEKLSSVFSNLFLLTLITNIITTIAYVIFIKSRYGGTEIYVACMVLTFNLLANIFYVEWVNEALENYDFITIKTIIIKLIYIVLLLLMVKTANNFNEYLMLLVLSTVLNNIASYFYIRRRIKFNFKKLELLKHIKPMFFVVILTNATLLYTQLDKTMLGAYISTENVAYYTMALNISSMINALMLTVIYVSIPRLSNYLAKNDNEEYLKLLDKIARLYLIFLFPAIIGMMVLSKEIILLYGGDQYIEAIPMLFVFAIYTITEGYQIILSNQIMYLKNREKEQVKIVFIGGLVNLILNIAILKLKIFTGTTAIITTMIANVIVVILEYMYVRVKLKIKFNIFGLDKSKYLFISLIFIPITFIIKKFVGGLITVTTVTVLVNALVYFIILYFIKDEILNEILQKVLSKVKRKTDEF